MPLLFLKALIGLLGFDLLLSRNFVRMRGTVRRWKVARGKTSTEVIDHVSDAVNRACVWYPKQALCLQRSAVTTCLLRSCGVPAEMVIGAQKLPFRAHAWVEVNGRVINERSDVRKTYGEWERC